MLARGLAPGSRVVAQEIRKAVEPLASRLQVPAGAPLLQVDRVRTGDGRPMAFEEAYLAADRYEGIEQVDFANASLFDVLEHRFGLRLADAEQRVLAVAIDAAQAELLEVDTGPPGLRFETLAWEADGRPAYFATSLFPGDRYEIQLRQTRMDG
jgi:GntR family transcriptional regulator